MVTALPHTFTRHGAMPMDRMPVTMALRSSQMPRRKWTVLAASEKWSSTRAMPVTWASRVARAAPVMPHLNQKMKMGARMMLIPTESRVEPMAFFG